MQITNDARLAELREQLQSIDFPENKDEGYIAPLSYAFRYAGKAYHGQIIADGIPAMLEIAKQTIISQIAKDLADGRG